jgi:hypothetical protein
MSLIPHITEDIHSHYSVKSIHNRQGVKAMNAQEKRESVVSQTVHNALLEGLNVSPAFQRDSNEYIAGTISANKLVDLTRERFGLAASN